jgi:hypothetical protein
VKPAFSVAKSRRLFRIVTTVCAIVVSSYILFDVLDLDGSNWPLAQNPGNSSFVVATEAVEIKPTALAKTPDSWALDYREYCSQHELAAYLFAVNETRISGLRSSRQFSHRAALPRSSIPDPSRSA